MSKLTEKEYRGLPRYSNSDLTAFHNYLYAVPERDLSKAFAFGTALHTAILEPHTIQTLPENVDIELIQSLVRNVRNDRWCKWLLQFSQKEQFFEFSDPYTGLPCKAKSDNVFRGSLMVDFKTTSAKSYAKFLDTCIDYNYDRQAAFYLNAVKAKRFVFIGLQKVAPYDVFYYEATADRGFVEAGQRKIKYLMSEIKQRNWRPQTWKIDPTTQEMSPTALT
jgi:hypothetical protein